MANTFKRVLIIGFGYIGQQLASTLQQRGVTVYGMRRHKPESQAQPAKMIYADVANCTPDQIPEVDAIIYLVTPDNYTEIDYQKAYPTGLTHILDLIPSSVQRVIFASSSCVYEQQQGEWVDEQTPIHPTHFSGQAIYAAESKLLQHPISSCSIRFAGIYGPDRYRRFLNKPASEQRYTNMIHATDVVGILTHILFHPSPDPLYIGSDSQPEQHGIISQWIAEQCHTPLNTPIKPYTQRTLSNKRLSNARIKASGYHFIFDNYQLGLKALIQ